MKVSSFLCFASCGVKTILFRKKEPILGTVKFNAEINAVKGEGKDLRDEVAKLKKRSDEITKELTKDRKGYTDNAEPSL